MALATRAAVAVVGLLAVAPPPARAEIRTERRSEHSEPVEPILRLALEQRYDDDVLLSGGQDAPGAFLTKVMPQLGLRLNQRTLKFEGFYEPQLLYRNTGGQLEVDHRAALELHTDASRTAHIDALGQFWDTSDPLSLPRQGLARTLARTLYGRAALGWQQRFAPRWSFLLGYRFEGAKVHEPDHPPGFLNSPSIELDYRLTRRADVGAEYRFQLFNFGGNNAVAHSPGLVWKYRLSRSARIQVSGGAAFYSEHQHPEKNGIVPRFQVDVAQQISKRLDWIFTVGHDLVGASGFSTAVWADYSSLTLSWQLLEKLRLFTYGSFFRNGPMPNVGVLPLKVDQEKGVAAGYGFGGGAEWRFNRHVAIQASYDRLDQVGSVDPAQTSLTRNIVAARLTVDAF
ncbi:MAG TPA: hypothetical protein VFE93_09670 [Myxococcaceae bacterium]|nr:hypothetical protein [Myxococcaceae bacterium]